jgi:hypothetical protein
MLENTLNINTIGPIFLLRVRDQQLNVNLNEIINEIINKI